MSMMCPPHRVKIVWTPSAFRAFATRWPPEMVAPAAVVSPAPDATVAPAAPLRAVPGTVWVMGRSAPRGRGRFHTAYRMEVPTPGCPCCPDHIDERRGPWLLATAYRILNPSS